uniref:Uncharacterized protein n=2 Tax=Picea TaxID=3328 RepID=A0A101LUP6_PICGL|nr:hypothetical protein ABT39_MTgene2529 [Picea glauca]QHR92908.1 hypothetical protein Q903MT_gene6957 [Picea sitchensis]
MNYICNYALLVLLCQTSHSSSPVSRACFRILSRWSSLLAHPLPHPYDE